MSAPLPRLGYAMAVFLCLVLAGCGGGSELPPPSHESPTAVQATPAPAATEEALPPLNTEQPDNLGPEDVLEGWITAQEQGDFGWAMTFLTESHKEKWLTLSDEMSGDDLTSSGLQFRQDAYALSFADDRLAVFWSDTAKLYLVMTREASGWKIDPDRTDEMNHERASSP